MKKIFYSTLIVAVVVSCSKKEASSHIGKTDSEKVDSINAARTRYNDSIKILNSSNRFKDFSGSHRLSYESEGYNKMSGTVNFDKITGERDSYHISGNIQAGKNSLKMNGSVKIVSPKHMNFTGEITQKISDNDNGKPYIRKGKKTFMSKDGGKTYRLQDMVNGSGFVDYIDIHF